MSHLIVNEFSSYEMSVEEELRGSTFSILQKQVLQNRRAIIAAEKNALEYDPQNPLRFAQQEAQLKGQLEIIQYLFDLSDASEEQLVEHINPNLSSDTAI